MGLFRPIARNYERWAAILSLGQDGRWRRRLVSSLHIPQGSLVLDVAAGTGSITRLLQASGYRVVSLDQSREMLDELDAPGSLRLLATAERLPIGDATVDGLTAGYLLRYVEDLSLAMDELARVVRPGGMVAMLEFGRPQGIWGPLWWFYTRFTLPIAGSVVGGGWGRVGRFLGPDIDRFWTRNSLQSLVQSWEGAGIGQVRWERMSLGGGFVIWGIKT